MRLCNRSAYMLLSFLFLRLANLTGQDLYTVNPVSFNMRDYDDFSARYYKDGVVFCSNRTQNVFIARVDSLGKPLLDLYFVKKKRNNHWTSPSAIFKGLKTTKHEGPFAFADDDNTIYVTRNQGDYNEIFVSSFNGSVWSDPVPFRYDDPNADVGHPCISPDGKQLFFVSNKRGGLGGFDIYVTDFRRNHWSAPKNLGPAVNSREDELFPFYNRDGRLYFASNRPGGLGGLDIYYTRLKHGKWISPVHLPAPINSRFNDFAYVSDSIDRHGFISSDRNSRAKLTDIYSFTMNFPVMSPCKAQEINDYTYEFTEKSYMDPDTTTFLYQWDFGDGHKIMGKSLDVDHTFPKPGDYLIKLNVIDTVTGKIYKNEATYLYPVRPEEQPYITVSDTVKEGQPVSFDGSQTYLPDKQIVNYYWDFGDDSIGQGEKITHTFLAPGKYKVILAVTYTTADTKDVASECRFKMVTVIKSP